MKKLKDHIQGHVRLIPGRIVLNAHFSPGFQATKKETFQDPSSSSWKINTIISKTNKTKSKDSEPKLVEWKLKSTQTGPQLTEYPEESAH